MLKKRVLSLFLILAFAIPVLPVLQIGRVLYQNQCTEEISSHGFSIVKQDDKADNDICPAFLYISLRVSSSAEKITINEKLLSRQADDVSTPPPNTILTARI
jgi:hypothetical protein